MPIYEYKCKECDHIFEILVLKRDDQQVACPNCNNKHVEKLLSSTNCRSNSSGIGASSSRGFKGFS